MLTQKDPAVLPDIQSECYFLVLAWMVAQEFKHQFTPDDINKMFDVCLSNNWVDRQATIYKPDKILMHMKSKTNTTMKTNIIQIGQTVDNTTVYWDWVPQGIIKNARRYTVAMEKTSGKYGTHFILVKSYKEPVIIYDSWNLARIGETTKAQRFIYYGVI